MNYLIGYDICDPKRLQRIYRKITKFATPLQYSIFWFQGEKAHLDKVLAQVLPLLNKKEDDLRIYPLASNTPYWNLGRPTLPEGIIWTAIPTQSFPACKAKL